MSARRLGACVNHVTKNHQARRLTTSRKWQQTASDSHEHKERLAVLQAEDLRLLQPVKANVKEYLAIAGKARDILKNMPATLQPALPLESVHSFATHRAVIADALASADRLKFERLTNLLVHLEDLEVEDYPEPGKDETELEFLARVKDMNPVERKGLLDTVSEQVDDTTKRLRQRVQNWTPEQEEAEAERAEAERAEAERAEAERAEAERQQMGARNPLPVGPSTGEQFANVMADATAKSNFGLRQQEDVRQWKPLEVASESKTATPESQPTAAATWGQQPTASAPKPKPSGFDLKFDLNSLQAKLEASIRKIAKR